MEKANQWVSSFMCLQGDVARGSGDICGCLERTEPWVISRVPGSVSCPDLWPERTSTMKEEPTHFRQKCCHSFIRQEDATGLFLPEYTIPVGTETVVSKSY